MAVFNRICCSGCGQNHNVYEKSVGGREEILLYGDAEKCYKRFSFS